MNKRNNLKMNCMYEGVQRILTQSMPEKSDFFLENFLQSFKPLLRIIEGLQSFSVRYRSTADSNNYYTKAFNLVIFPVFRTNYSV